MLTKFLWGNHLGLLVKTLVSRARDSGFVYGKAGNFYHVKSQSSVSAEVALVNHIHRTRYGGCGTLMLIGLKKIYFIFTLMFSFKVLKQGSNKNTSSERI